MPKYCWRAGPETTAAIRALKAGQEIPKLNPMKRNASATAAGVVANARTTQPTSWEAVASSSMTRAPIRSVSEPPGRGHRQGEHRDERHEQAGESEPDTADLVQVDHGERERQAAAEGLYRDGRQQPTALGGQFGPERAQAAGGAHGGNRPKRPRQPHNRFSRRPSPDKGPVHPRSHVGRTGPLSGHPIKGREEVGNPAYRQSDLRRHVSLAGAHAAARPHTNFRANLSKAEVGSAYRQGQVVRRGEGLRLPL